jgi:hypothetical protein
MAAARNKNETPQRLRAKTLFPPLLLTACFCLAGAGCSLLPAGASRLPSKIGLKSQQAELRDRVKADKFPTAKEAGL